MVSNYNDNARSAVLAAVREVANSQGGTEPAGRDLGAGKHKPGVAEGMTGRDDPSPNVFGDYDGTMRRDFKESDNVSYKEDDGFYF